MDFGSLKNKFTELYIESHINGEDKGKELYKTFLSTIKESETLKSYFIIYKNLESKLASSESEAYDYLKENLSVLDKFRGGNSIVNECKKLVNLLENNDIELKWEPNEFNKSLHILTTNSRNVNTINTIQEAKSLLVKHLMEEKEDTKNDSDLVRENLDVKKFLSIVTDKYNEKYSSLTEEEKNIIKVLRSGNIENKKELLQNMIKETISVVNENLNKNTNVELKEKLLETKDVVYSMVDFDSTTFGENIKKLYNIKTVFNQ